MRFFCNFKQIITESVSTNLIFEHDCVKNMHISYFQALWWWNSDYESDQQWHCFGLFSPPLSKYNCLVHFCGKNTMVQVLSDTITDTNHFPGDSFGFSIMLNTFLGITVEKIVYNMWFLSCYTIWKLVHGWYHESISWHITNSSWCEMYHSHSHQK